MQNIKDISDISIAIKRNKKLLKETEENKKEMQVFIDKFVDIINERYEFLDDEFIEEHPELIFKSYPTDLSHTNVGFSIRVYGSIANECDFGLFYTFKFNEYINTKDFFKLWFDKNFSNEQFKTLIEENFSY